MNIVEQSVEVEAPLEAVYDAWTRFEDFPEFMEGVEDVLQLDETHVHVRLRILGDEREFDAEITEQRPCERIAWCAVAGDSHTGSVTFERLGEARTRLVLRLGDDTASRFARAADASFHARRVRGDLDRFKAIIEAAPARFERPS